MSDIVERDIYEVANQLGGYVGPGTPKDLASFLLRESAAAAKLADEIVRLRSLDTQHHQGGAVEEALKFYADPENWDDGHFVEDEPNSLTMVMCTIDNDRGEKARAALAQQPLSVQEGWQQALDKPFCVLFLDGRNEHGSHVLASYPRSFDTAETNIEDEAETILTEAEALGFSIGDHVWAEFDWTAPQIDNEGRTELTGYWEFKRINPEMTRAAAPTVGGTEE